MEFPLADQPRLYACRLTLVLLSFCTPALLAQNAVVAGAITDASDSAVPRAAISLLDESKGTRRETVTNASGTYSIVGLPPGVYTLEVKAAGFQTSKREHVTLAVAQSAQIDFRLQVGAAEQTVSVEAQPASVNTTDASVSTVIDRQLVQSLPLNGRSFHSLIELAPGVVPAATNEQSRGTYAVNGQRSNSNSYMVDGISVNLGVGASQTMGQSGTGTNMGTSAVGGANNLVSLDALEEFRVVTSTYAPEYGRTPGGQVSVVTRSGTNQFHGALFEYFRNEKLDANDWFLNRSGIARPPLRQNDFGGVLGGPVIKNRTFFFFSYEALRLRQPAAGISDVPSLELRRTAPEGVRPYLNAYPLPTGPAGNNGLAPVLAGVSNPSQHSARPQRHQQAAGLRAFQYGSVKRQNPRRRELDQQRTGLRCAGVDTDGRSCCHAFTRDDE